MSKSCWKKSFHKQFRPLSHIMIMLCFFFDCYFRKILIVFSFSVCVFFVNRYLGLSNFSWRLTEFRFGMALSCPIRELYTALTRPTEPLYDRCKIFTRPDRVAIKYYSSIKSGWSGTYQVQTGKNNSTRPNYIATRMLLDYLDLLLDQYTIAFGPLLGHLAIRSVLEFFWIVKNNWVGSPSDANQGWPSRQLPITHNYRARPVLDCLIGLDRIGRERNIRGTTTLRGKMIFKCEQVNVLTAKIYQPLLFLRFFAIFFIKQVGYY